MSAIEQSLQLADADVRAIMESAEAQATRVAGLSRRSFIKVSGLTGAGLVLAFYIGDRSVAFATNDSAAKDFVPNAFLRIAPDGTIVIVSKGPEIGQGIKSAFPMIIAEELDADWSRVKVEQAAINPAVFGRQSAGGSRSIPTSWDQLRRAGAAGRAMLVSAAAKQWNVPEAELTTASSVVTHKASRRSATYGELASKAAELPVPD